MCVMNKVFMLANTPLDWLIENIPQTNGWIIVVIGILTIYLLFTAMYLVSVLLYSNKIDIVNVIYAIHKTDKEFYNEST